MEAARLMWNKILLVLIHLVDFFSRDDDGLVRWRLTGSAASISGDSCVGVMVLAAPREVFVRFALDRYDGRAPSSPGLRWDGQI